MIKIIWNREDFEKIQEKIMAQFDLSITVDPNEVPEHKIGLLLTDENKDTLKAFVEALMLESSQMLFPTPDGYIQVQVRQLTFLEAFGDEIYMHLEKGSSQLIRQPLYQLEEKTKVLSFHPHW